MNYKKYTGLNDDIIKIRTEVSAQVRVSEFYKKLGYNKIGDIYLDEFCEHIRMVKNL